MASFFSSLVPTGTKILTHFHAQFESTMINHTPPQGPRTPSHPTPRPPPLFASQSTLQMHGGSLNAPSALRFGQAATRVLCSKLSPAGVRKASRLNSCFNLVPIYKRNQRGFLLRPFSFHPILSFSTIQRLNNQASKNLKFWSGS